MKRKKNYLIIFFAIIQIFICCDVANAAQLSGNVCDPEAVDQLAMIIYHETGLLTSVKDEDFFANLTTGSVALNNASGGNGDTLAKKIQNMTDNQYQGHSTYKYSTITKELSDPGKFIYIAGLVLSNKYNVPKNINWQIAAAFIPGTPWLTIQATYKGAYTTSYGTGGPPLVSTDIFGNNVPTDVNYYRELSKTLQKDDYSSYTLDNVCSKVANISDGESGGSSNGNSGVNKCNVSLNIHTCENPDFVRVIYFIKLLIGILEIIVPIGLIIMGIVDFSKSVATNDETIQKKNIMLFFKRIIYAILVFAVPWIVKVIIVSLGDLTKEVNFTDCLENATSEKIDELQSDYNKLEEEYRKNNCSIDNNNDSDDDGNLDNKVNPKSNSIFIGDSRTVGMFNCVDKKSNEFSIAKGGAGSSWLNGTVLTELKTTIKGKEDSYIIINMGTNSGLTENEANQYAQLYNKIATDYPNSQVVAVSVTQIDVNTAKSNGMYSGISLTSDSVNKFNGYLKNKLDSKIKYCDVYSKIASTYKTLDGVHYDCNTYKDIYNAINSCLK